MKYLPILAFLIITAKTFAQQVTQINGYKAVIFADTVGLPFHIDSIKSRYSPQMKDIVKANDLILKNKSSFISAWGKLVSKEIKNSNRQYVGYFDIKGNLHLIVFLLNFKAKNSKKYFKGWLKSPIVGFGEFYEKNEKALDVNLTKNLVEIY